MAVLKSISAAERKIVREEALKHLRANGFSGGRRLEVLRCCATYGLAGFGAIERGFNPSVRGKGLDEKLRDRILVEAAAIILEDVVKDANASGKSLVIATINTKQVIADKALTKAGFRSTGWAYRNPSRSSYRTGVKVYVKHAFPIKKETK